MIICGCSKGYASEVDGLCRFCRENKYSRAFCKEAGVRHNGDGLTLDQEDIIIKKHGLPPRIEINNHNKG